MCQSFRTNNRRKKRKRKATRTELKKHQEIRISKLAKMDAISLMKITMKTEQNKNRTDATEFGLEYETKIMNHCENKQKGAKKKILAATTSV